MNKLTIDCINWIKDWFKNNGNQNTKAIIGISGGKDSTVAAKLLVEALGANRVIGVLMPNGYQADISDSIHVCELLGIENYTININGVYSELTEELRKVSVNGIKFPSDGYITNTPARLRMTVLYGIGALIGNCRVCNTCNLSEEIVGYSTIFGDLAGDFSPLGKLTTEEIIEMGLDLGLPNYLVNKVPSDGMCGLSDEDNLGFTYHEINEYIRYKIKGPNFNNILIKYNANKFKHNLIQIPVFYPGYCNNFDLL